MTQLKKKSFYRFNQVKLKNLHTCKAGMVPKSNRWKTCRLESHDSLNEEDNGIIMSPVRKSKHSCWFYKDPLLGKWRCIYIE